MADDNETPEPTGPKVKDLLRSGELDAHEHKGEDFGSSVMRRHMRRPVGNSERLWKKVDGEDPWDLPRPKKAPKQRGVYASGRFVRIDKGQPKKSAKKADHVPAWAREKQRAAAAARANPKGSSEPEVKAVPTADDAIGRLQQIIAQRNAENEAKKDKAVDAAARLKEKAAEAEAAAEAQAAAPPPVPVKVGPSKTGRMRTQRSSGRTPTARSADGPGSELTPEMRSVPRVPHQKKKHKIPPEQRRYAAGRSAPPPRPPPKDIPIEMRRPPRILPGDKKEEPAAPVQHRYAAGRSAPPPRPPPKDIPIEMRRPPRFGPDGQVLPPSESPAAPPRADAPVPVAAADETPPAAPELPVKAPPKAPPKPPERRTTKPGGGGGMDDLFGMASAEGPMRIGRSRRKKAAPEQDSDAD